MLFTDVLGSEGFPHPVENQDTRDLIKNGSRDAQDFKLFFYLMEFAVVLK